MVKKYEILQDANVPLGEGVQALPKYKRAPGGGMALRMMRWRSCCKLDRLSAPRLTKQHSSPFNSPLFDRLCCFEVLAVVWSLELERFSVITEQTDLPPVGWIPKRICGFQTKKKNRLQQKPVYKSGGIKTKPQKCPDHITIRHGTFLSVHESASLSFLLDPVVQF